MSTLTVRALVPSADPELVGEAVIQAAQHALGEAFDRTDFHVLTVAVDSAVEAWSVVATLSVPAYVEKATWHRNEVHAAQRKGVPL